MYADSGWKYQYWGGEPENGVVATNATITGPGTYKVGLDFTQTEDKMAAGIAFTALGIKTGERSFPGYFINIKDIKVNGESVKLKKGYTSSDDKIVTRMNIYNEWVGELPKDARLTTAKSMTPTDNGRQAAFDSVETVEVTFELFSPRLPRISCMQIHPGVIRTSATLSKRSCCDHAEVNDPVIQGISRLVRRTKQRPA